MARPLPLAFLTLALAGSALAGGMPPEVALDANGVPLVPAGFVEPVDPSAAIPAAPRSSAGGAPVGAEVAAATAASGPAGAASLVGAERTPTAAAPAVATPGLHRDDFGGRQ